MNMWYQENTFSSLKDIYSEVMKNISVANSISEKAKQINETYKTTIQNLGDVYRKAMKSISTVNAISKIVEQMNETYKAPLNVGSAYKEAMKGVSVANQIQFNVFSNIDKITSLGNTIANFSDQIAKIDWTDFGLTNEDIKDINDVLESETAEEQIVEELSKNPKKISKAIMGVVWFIYFLMQFLSNTADVIKFTEDRVIPVMESYMDYERKGTFQSKNSGIKWINNELKKDVSSQITNKFRIVTKEELVIREGKTKDSRIAGKLDAGYVVQILEKKKNWSYVFYSNYEDNEVVEGWTSTRYLKQIK